jgi:predicted GH43/DUF377 family glycosyl hydrolase
MARFVTLEQDPAPQPAPVPLQIKRLPTRFIADQRWVITRPFFPGGELRVRNVIQRVDELPDAAVERMLQQVLAGFRDRHPTLDEVFERHYELAVKMTGPPKRDDRPRRLLVGSYFTMEYSIASAALFNPSIVPHPDQTGVPHGSQRFIMSLRATGEGHISSLVFRTGLVSDQGDVQIDSPRRHTRPARLSPDRTYEKQLFRRKLVEMVLDRDAIDAVMNRLPDFFTLTQLQHAIEQARTADPERFRKQETAEGIEWLARENYQVSLPPEASISEVVLYPQSDNESRGIEDLRLVPFVDDDGTRTYYGTYSAFNGFRVLPQMMETRDFHSISVHTLNGAAAQNKGMALFPKRIGGHYCMCSRIDGENLYIMYSDMVQFWESAELLQTPKHPWEFTQIGNCGSPLETPEGWLLLTHGVGPMRSYSIGAMLLDLHDPLKVIGHLDEPLLVPTEEEREGYVPNVVYTCGAMIAGPHLIIPYAMSDTTVGIAVVGLKELLERLVP